jgi:hypothetical protein
MLLNRAAKIEESALLFPQFAQLHSGTCVQLKSDKFLEIAVASFLAVLSPVFSILLPTAV